MRAFVVANRMELARLLVDVTKHNSYAASAPLSCLVDNPIVDTATG